MLFAYIAIRAAADLKLEDETPFDDLITEVLSSKREMNDPSAAETILELNQAKAQLSLLKAEVQFLIGREAPEGSYENMVYQLERAAGTSLDGVVARRLDLPYQPGTSKGTLKIKRLRNCGLCCGWGDLRREQDNCFPHSPRVV